MLRSNSRPLNSLGNPRSQSWRRKGKAAVERIREKEGFKPYLCCLKGNLCVLHVLIFMRINDDDDDAEHSTVESYTVFICKQSYLLLFGDHPLTLSLQA